VSARAIAVIGAGFSGTLLTLHLLRRTSPATRIVLFERNSQFARGQAYSTSNPSHLLNVPAGRMSAFGDRPLDFLRWLRERPDVKNCPPPTSSCFVSRKLYGSYIRHLLNEELKDGKDRLQLVRGDVVGLDVAEHGVTVRLDRDREIGTDLAVLAVGNFPPESPRVDDPSFYASPHYCADPWSPAVLEGLDPDVPVLLIGTGLTMVDVAVALLDHGHRGVIHAISRRGLASRSHASTLAPDEPLPSLPASLVPLLQLVRRHAARTMARGGTWQQAIDQLRPFTQELWETMSHDDRARFLRHLRPWWDVHRHRAAGPVAERIEAARASGQLRLAGGRIRNFRERDGGVEVTWCRRHTAQLQTLYVARVVNCSGPQADYARISDPLIRGLLAEGLVRPDPLRLGLDVTRNGAARDRSGAISSRVFAVGPVTKGAFWEITAVPDIRRQCEYQAAHLASLVRALSPAPPLAANGGDGQESRASRQPGATLAFARH